MELVWTLGRLVGGGGAGMEWIHLAQGRDLWWAVVNAVMNHRVQPPRSLFVSYFQGLLIEENVIPLLF
jgi:hypothetical protein